MACSETFLREEICPGKLSPGLRVPHCFSLKYRAHDGEITGDPFSGGLDDFQYVSAGGLHLLLLHSGQTKPLSHDGEARFGSKAAITRTVLTEQS